MTGSARKSWVWLLPLLFQCVSVWAQAPPSRSVEDLAVLVDPHGRATILEIADPTRAADFQPAPRGFSAGYTRKVHWLRFSLEPPEPNAEGDRTRWLEVQPPYLDDLRLYIPIADAPDALDGYREIRTGDTRPFSERPIPARTFVFPIDFPDAAPQTLYLRIATSSSSVAVLTDWSPDAFIGHQALSSGVLGLFFGLMLALLLFGLWHGLWRHEAVHRLYLLYLAMSLSLLFGINGLASELVFPEQPAWGHHWAPVSLMLSVAVWARFFPLILEVGPEQRGLRLAYRWIFALSVLGLPASVLGYFTEAMNLLMPLLTLTLLLGLGRSLALWRRRRLGSPLLVVAHAFSLLGLLAASLTLMGLLPGRLWLIHGFQLSVFATLLALQQTLTLRIRALDDERRKALAAARVAEARTDEIRGAQEQQGRMVAMLLHEIKTPLSVLRMVLGMPDLIVRDPGRTRARAERAVTDIDAIVERCALAERIDSGGIHLAPRPCRLDRLLTDVAADPGHDGGRLIWGRAALAALPPLETDCTLLRVILSNLIDNALKYSPPADPVTIAIAPGTREGVDVYRLTVDNRLGRVGRPDPGRIFDKYYRAPGAHAHAGSGLGLYVVQGLCLRLGGSVSVDIDGDRITVAVWLPRSPPP